MIYLLAGLIVFLGAHSIHLFANDWRVAQIERLGRRRWKMLYALTSVVGLVLIIWGFGVARREASMLWFPPVGLHHATELFTLISFILLTAADVPRNPFKAWVHHPMVLGTAIWALGHLLSNGSSADILLFGAFFIWSTASFVVNLQRDRRDGILYPAGTPRGAIITVVAGIVAWIVFAFWLHGPLIGVRPFA
ncbi:NnrU family protein [Pararobbsia alpina]|uniref:NnrU domain-containing protein n=1 Tax=Pararobbsia alpina TaxID=621374 RepID=A0A6S7CXW4_9BURK|nr:NnrU family protein [Pararobbsia alpina]CAB3790877.1 hypothetical protein LMG28138_03049 [Pararobbsia alpina]